MESEHNIPRAPTPIPMLQTVEKTTKDENNDLTHDLTAIVIIFKILKKKFIFYLRTYHGVLVLTKILEYKICV